MAEQAEFGEAGQVWSVLMGSEVSLKLPLMLITLLETVLCWLKLPYLSILLATLANWTMCPRHLLPPYQRLSKHSATKLPSLYWCGQRGPPTQHSTVPHVSSPQTLGRYVGFLMSSTPSQGLCATEVETKGVVQSQCKIFQCFPKKNSVS